MREVRTVKVQGLRAEKREGKEYLSGHVAVFGAVAEIGAGNKMFRERVMPGAFARAIREGQDVRHLQNHDPNRVLGRTSVKTTVLSEDETGLRFETLLPDTSYARDLAVLVDRGDVNEGSFGFECRAGGDRWVKEGGIEIRDLVDVDLFDVSTVTFPAYMGTNAELSQRAMFPDGVPAEIRSRLERPAASGAAPDVRVKESRQRLGVLVTMPARAPEFRAAVQADGTFIAQIKGLSVLLGYFVPIIFAFIGVLGHPSSRYGIVVLAYALMPMYISSHKEGARWRKAEAEFSRVLPDSQLS